MQFGKLPKDVMQARVSMGAKVLYAALAMYRNGRTLQCNPSQTQLAETIGVSATHINHLANELQCADLIMRDQIPGRQTCYFLPHLDADLDTETTQHPARTTTQHPARTLPNILPGHYPTSCQESPIEVSEQTSEQTIEQTVGVAKKVPEAKNEKPNAYQPSPETLKALEIWEGFTPLPQTASREKCLKVLDELHRLDGLTWDRIYRICTHGAREWVPQGFIASPAKLRTPTRSGEMKTWEAIERQARGQPSRGRHPPPNAEDYLAIPKGPDLAQQQRDYGGN